MKKNEEHSKEENGVKTRKGTFYSLLAMGSVLLAGVIVLIVLAANGVFAGKDPSLDNNPGKTPETPSSNRPADDPKDDTNDDKPAGTTVSYVNPLDAMTVLNRQGFYYNSTLNRYYEHVGIDVSAEEGANVYSIADGTIEGIYTADVLQGTQVVINHGNGVKSVYSFVDPVEELKAGASVKQGDVIAKIAKATGCEYKDGAHLHLEMYVGEKSANPENYLTLEEK